MSHKIKDTKKELTQDLVGEIENVEDDTRMFKAAQVLYTKHQRVHFKHGKQEQCVSQPQQSFHSVKWQESSQSRCLHQNSRVKERKSLTSF